MQTLKNKSKYKNKPEIGTATMYLYQTAYQILLYKNFNIQNMLQNAAGWNRNKFKHNNLNEVGAPVYLLHLWSVICMHLGKFCLKGLQEKHSTFLSEYFSYSGEKFKILVA